MTNTTTGTVDIAAAVESLITDSPRHAHAPQVGRPNCSDRYCHRMVEADGLCERHLRNVRLLDVHWLSRDEAIVTWAWEHSARDDHEGFTTVSIVWVDRCPADRSVGINAPYYEVSSECPVEVDELVAEAASERDEDDGPDYGPEDRDDRWDDDDDERFESFGAEVL